MGSFTTGRTVGTRFAILLAGCLLACLAIAGAARAATPTLQVTADATAGFGDNASASVTIAGGSNPTGEITISLYGPGQPDCTGGAAERTQDVSGPGPYSDGFMVLAEGTWKWRISYSGDANNTAVTTPCGVAETVVGAAPTEIEATATPGAELGQPLSAEAQVWGGLLVEGELTFEAFGPGNAACSGAPAFSATVPIDVEALTSSGQFTPTAPGEYRWVVSYEGDDIHQGSSTECGAEGLTSVVTGDVPPPPPPTCATDPGMAGCQQPPTKRAAALSVAVAPKARTVKKGKTATVRVTIANTGEESATGVKACASAAKAGFKVIGRCREFGSLAGGSTEVVAFKVRPTKKAKGKARVTVKVSSGNAGGGTGSATVKVRK